MRIQTNEGEDRISSLVDKYNLTDESGRYSYERVQEAKRNLVGSWGEAFGVLADVADVLRENPRASTDVLFEHVRGCLERVSLERVNGEGLSHLAGMLFLRLSDRHRRMLSFYDGLEGNPRRIYEELFESTPSGNVEVRLGPSCLNVICTRDDFNRARLGKGYVEGQVPISVMNSGGVNLRVSCRIAGLAGGVNLIVREPWMNTSDVERAIAHEEAHALFSVISMEPPAAFEHALKRLNDSLESGDRRQASYWLMQHLRSLRSAIEPRAADEIIAFSIDGRFNKFREITEILMQPKEVGGLYDFTGDLIRLVEEETGIYGLLEFFDEIGLTGAFDMFGYEDVEFAMRRVFEHEFADLIDEGVAAFSRLKSRGYTYNEILYILSQFPLRRWRQASCRFAEQRQIPFDKFFVRSFTHSFGVPVVVADKDGNIYSDNRFQLDRYVSRGDQAVALFSYTSDPNSLPVPVMREVDLGQPADLDSIVQGIDEEPPIRLALMSADALRALNYPYKTPKDWYDIWVRSGGDPKVKDELDFSSQEPVPATEIWGKFRKYAKPGSRELSVFRAYRRIQREAF